MSSQRRKGPAVPARLRRSLAFASTSALLAWLAHGLGGGALPDVWFLLLGACVLMAGIYPLLGREATWVHIALGLAGAQVLLHAWLTVTAHSAEHAEHAVGHGSSHGFPARMLTALVAATAAAVVWLRYGERQLWIRARQLWVAVILRRRRWLGVPAEHLQPALAPAGWLPPALATDFLVSAHGTRGPPRPAGP
jgi:hypothetical protein